MANKRGAHQRPENEQNAYRQSASQQSADNRQGQYRQERYQQERYGQGQHRQGRYQQDPYAQDQYTQNQYQQAGYSQDSYQQSYQGADDQFGFSQQQEYYEDQTEQFGYPQGAFQQANQGFDGQQGAYQQSYQQPVAYQQYGGHQNAAPSTGQYAGFENDYVRVRKKRRKRHPVRNVLIVLLVILVIVGGFAGFTGYTLYNSAKVVKADASAILTDVNDLKTQLLSDNPSQANTTASDIAKRAKKMESETNGWAWKAASFIPVYGEDVAIVKDLSSVLVDLSDNAIVPLVGEMSQISMDKVLVDGAINVEYANKLIAAINTAAPEISRCSAKLQSMGEAHLDQINSPLTKAKNSLDELNTVSQFASGIAPMFSDMLGANGSPRNYLVVACQPAEIRASGGFLGSIGVMSIDNGRIEMGDFMGIAEIYPTGDNADVPKFEITQEEANIFGGHVTTFLGNASYIPDWARVSEIITYYWEVEGRGSLDGMIGVDPVFLQHLLALTGSVTTSSGVTVDGTNAARLLGHDMYYLSSDEQDAFYEEVASLAFDQIFSNLGSVPLMTFVNQVSKDMEDRRFQICMVNESEEEVIALLGADGRLPTDPTKPKLGVYINDDSWSKMFWYLKISTDLSTGEKLSNGTTVYHAKTTYSNMLAPGSESELSPSMVVHNVGLSRSEADMVAWVMLSAPAGGSIINMQTDGYFTPYENISQDRGVEYPGGMVSAPYNGIEMWYGLGQILPGESITLTYDVVVPDSATEPLEMITTPTYQEVAGW